MFSVRGLCCCHGVGLCSDRLTSLLCWSLSPVCVLHCFPLKSTALTHTYIHTHNCYHLPDPLGVCIPSSDSMLAWTLLSCVYAVHTSPRRGWRAGGCHSRPQGVFSVLGSISGSTTLNAEACRLLNICLCERKTKSSTHPYCLWCTLRFPG